jgi:AcrR family transcriptional regulator
MTTVEMHEATAPEGRVARRRAQVRQRILDVAEKLIAERGVDGVTVDEIADAADIARRSFYHHFESKHEILIPIARARTRALTRRIDGSIAAIDDPAEIVASAMRHGLRQITADPLCRWFILYSGLPQERLYEGMGESGVRDTIRAVEAGRFRIDNVGVARLLLSGAFVAVLSARVAGRLDDGDLDDAVEHLLRLCGLHTAEAHDIAHRPLPPLLADPGDDEPRRERRDGISPRNEERPRRSPEERRRL